MTTRPAGPDTDAVRAQLLRAIADPARVVRRGDDYTEPLPQWQLRAVNESVVKPLLDEIRTLTAARDALAGEVQGLREERDEWKRASEAASQRHDPARLVDLIEQANRAEAEVERLKRVVGSWMTRSDSHRADRDRLRAELEETRARLRAALAERKQVKDIVGWYEPSGNDDAKFRDELWEVVQ